MSGLPETHGRWPLVAAAAVAPVTLLYVSHLGNAELHVGWGVSLATAATTRAS